MSVRLKLFGVSVLLCLALASVIFAAVSTVQAYQAFERDHQRILAGDVSTISPWMTLPYIARVYHVPEGCLFQSLHISKPLLKYHATLRFIADYSHWPIETLLSTVRTTVLRYRSNHNTCNISKTQHIRVSRYPPSLPERGDNT